MTKISIGIVLYKNEEQEVHRSLTSVLDQRRDLVAEILVRDQGGGGCLPFVDAWSSRHSNAPPIRYEEGANIGFGAAHNALVSKASPDSTAYLCLNPDGIMHPNCLSEMVALAERERWRGIFEAIQEPVMHPKYFDSQTGETAWCSGACLLIPNDIYREVAGYDDDFFLYCEDVDLSWRVKAAGYHCFTCADALFLHYAVDRGERNIEMWRSACILAHKWRASKFKQHALKVLTTLTDIDQAALKQDLEKSVPHSLTDIYRAKPDFKNNHTFARPMWS